jgi:hypothetical protein
MGDAIVVTGSDRSAPLAQSTSKIFALTIKFRYVAETTRFSNSTNLIAQFIAENTAWESA